MKELSNQEELDLKKIELDSRKIQLDEKKVDYDIGKIKAETQKIINEASNLELQIESDKELNKTFSLLNKMIVLSRVMTASFSQDSNLPGNHLFEKDELIEYKGKMLELVKQL